MIRSGFKITLSLSVTLLLLVLTLQCQSQSVSHDKAIISALMDPVREGAFIDPNAWLIDESGDSLTYAKTFAGKWLLIDYWTAGCAPCIKEFPVLNAFYQTIDRSKLEIITLSVDRKMNRWKKARKKYQFDMPKYYAGWSSQNHFLALNYVLMENKDGSERIVTLTPQYVLISPERKIVNKALPKPSSPEFLNTLNQYLKKNQ